MPTSAPARSACRHLTEKEKVKKQVPLGLTEASGNGGP